MMRLACSTLNQYVFEEKPSKNLFGATLSKTMSKTISKNELKGNQSLSNEASSFQDPALQKNQSEGTVKEMSEKSQKEPSKFAKTKDL